jgi:hypothetical protein
MKTLSLGVFSWNEANEPYTVCPFAKSWFPRIRMSLGDPDILVVCTQESLITRDFSHSLVLYSCIFAEDYCLVAQNELAIAGLGHVAFLKGKARKNVRTSVLIKKTVLGKETCPRTHIMRNNDKISFPIFVPLKTTQKRVSLDSLEIEVKLHSFKANTKAKGLKSGVLFTFHFKRAKMKIQIINTHLYFHEKGKEGDQGFAERSHDLDELIDAFHLPTEYKNGTSIIFCGDLNFRNNPHRDLCPEIKKQLPKIGKQLLLEQKNRGILTSRNKREIEEYHRGISTSRNKKEIEECAKHILNLYRTNSSQLKEYMQLYAAFHQLRKQASDSKAANKRELLQALESTIYIGYPTCRYQKKERSPILFAEQSDMEKIKMLLNPEKNELGVIHGVTPRIPSTCDQILFATKDEKFQLTRPIIPFSVGEMAKSDHLAVYERFSLAMGRE